MARVLYNMGTLAVLYLTLNYSKNGEYCVVENSKSDISDLKDANSALSVLPELLKTSEGRAQARELCYKILASDYKATRVRLMLARSFYLDGYAEFCLRELCLLKALVNVQSLDRLISAICPSAPYVVDAVTLDINDTYSKDNDAPSVVDEEDGVVAEIDIDAEFLDDDLLESLAEAEEV